MSQPIQVLLADDHAVVRAGIRQFLEQVDDIQVVAEADDGLMAQTLITTHQPDVAVLDIQMPYATGIEVTRWIRQNYPHMGVLVLTAFDDNPYITAVLQAGANGYVLKTASPMAIVQAVQDVYTGKPALDQTVTQKLITQIANKTTHAAYDSLTKRELDVLKLAGKGDTNKAIGIHLGISDRTVQGHLAKIYNKLQVNSRTEAVTRAIALGLITAEIES